MFIFHEYIQQCYQAATGYAPDYDDIYWQLTEETPYVNTRTLYRKAELTGVMGHMLAGLDTTDGTVERCRHILGCWIDATDWLASQTGYVDHVPRVHPQISGRTDQLLRPDILPLYELDGETFREATGQQEVPADRYITPAQFRQSERYWFRFMDWFERALRDVSHRCCGVLTKFVARCPQEETQIRRWQGEYGELRLTLCPTDIDDIDIMEFEDGFLTEYVEGVAAGLFVPVTFRADVHYRNGVRLASFTSDTEVNEPEHPGAADFCDVVNDAIEWIRQEVEILRPPVSSRDIPAGEIQQERQLAA